MGSTFSSEPLEAARAAVQRSDQGQGTSGELIALRDALRALIQWAEAVDEKVMPQKPDPDIFP